MTPGWTQEGPGWPEEDPGGRQDDHRMAPRRPRMAPRWPQDGPKSAQRREAASDPNRIRFRSQPDPTRNRQGPDHGSPRRARGENYTKNGSQNGSQNALKSDPKIGRFSDPYREAFLVLLAEPREPRLAPSGGVEGQLKAPKPLYL